MPRRAGPGPAGLRASPLPHRIPAHPAGAGPGEGDGTRPRPLGPTGGTQRCSSNERLMINSDLQEKQRVRAFAGTSAFLEALRARSCDRCPGKGQGYLSGRFGSPARTRGSPGSCRTSPRPAVSLQAPQPLL